MEIKLYKNDIPDDVDLGKVIGIDTETLGLNLVRDRLCLVQMSSGDGCAHLVQFESFPIRIKNKNQQQAESPCHDQDACLYEHLQLQF